MKIDFGLSRSLPGEPSTGKCRVAGHSDGRVHHDPVDYLLLLPGVKYQTRGPAS